MSCCSGNQVAKPVDLKPGAGPWMNTEKWKAGHSLIKEVFDEMKAADADELNKMAEVGTRFNWNLNKATICAQKLKQHVGIYAGDAETFTDMAPVFDKVILKYHNVDVSTNEAAEEMYEKVSLPQLSQADAIVSTRIRTARNLASLPFTVNMTKEQRCKLETIMKEKVFPTFEGKLKGEYHGLVGMDENKRKELVNLHYLYINDDPTLELVGCYEDWPQGRGIFINDDPSDKFLVWVGEEDQLRIMAMNKGSNVQAVWDLFYSGVEAVHKAVKALGDDFVFDKARGYLSSCPTNIGTGMRASVHVDLPGFKTKEDCKKWVKEQGLMIDIRGTRGEATSTEGITRYDVSNKARLGSDCVTQITTMVEGVSKLLEASAGMEAPAATGATAEAGDEKAGEPEAMETEEPAAEEAEEDAE